MSRPVPESPPDDGWHTNIPGPGCSVEDLRWFCIREVGALKDTAKVNGTNLHQLVIKVEILTGRVDALDGRVDAKAEATRVQAEFDSLKQEVGTELGKIVAETDTAGMNARMVSMAETVNVFGAQVQEAFQHAKAVETSFQAHVSQGFSEAVGALQWLESHVNQKGEQVANKLLQLELAMERSAGLDPAGQTRAPPPPEAHASARPARAVPAGRAAPAFSVLGGCNAGPYACGCGDGAVPGQPAGPAPAGPTCTVATDPSGECHCKHVTTLMEELAALKTQINHLKASYGAKPFLSSEVKGSEPVSDPEEPTTDTSLPLKLGPIGSLASGRSPFDTKIAGQSHFQFSSHKGSDQWKGKTERYMMSVVPAVHAIFAWAEKQESPITQTRYEEPVGYGLCTYDRDGVETDHSYTLNSLIWGFLSNCVSGEAQTIFKNADPLMGVEAWRRLSRFIDHGREIRLETSRNEVRNIRGKFVIKNLEEVVIGIAKFENKLDEYVAAGGTRPDDHEMKSDLNAILPIKLSEMLCLKQSDPKMSYETFKNFVEGQTAQILMNQGRLPVNVLDDGNEEEAYPEGDE